MWSKEVGIQIYASMLMATALRSTTSMVTLNSNKYFLSTEIEKYDKTINYYLSVFTYLWT